MPDSNHDDPFPVMEGSLPIWDPGLESGLELDPELAGNESADRHSCRDSSETRSVISCSACPIRDCPTRGLVTPELQAALEAERDSTMTPGQMVASSTAVFLFPLICAVAGVFAWNESGIGSLSQEAGSVCGAVTGFLSGLLLVQLIMKLIMKLMRFRNGQ